MSPPETDPGSVKHDSGVIAAADAAMTKEELLAAIDETIKPFSDGDLVSGTIVKIDKEEVLVDIGYKSEGVIPVRELSIRNDVDPSEIVSLGERIEALVLQKEDAEGRLILSKKRAQYERAWGRVEEIKRSGGVVEGTVIEVVKGGLIVDIGLRGFLPASLVELRRVRDLHPYIGKTIECKIIELDKHRNNVVLSRRAFLEESHVEQRKEFLDRLKPGDRLKGTISSIVNYGAFVDLGAMDGLIHVSELSWRHVEHPSEVVKTGQEVEVEVISVELERERVSLSLKNTQEDPWQAFARDHQSGDVITGTITRLVPFGAFIQLGEGVEGLAHVSELSDEHVELPEQVVSLGQEAQVRVLDIDVERRRVSLSMKQARDDMAAMYSTTTAAPASSPDETEETPEPEAELEIEPELELETQEAEVGVQAKVETPIQQDEATGPARATVPAMHAATAARTEAEPEQEPGASQPVEGEAEPEGEPDSDAAKEPLEGELLEKEEGEADESLEDIVADMKRDRER